MIWVPGGARIDAAVPWEVVARAAVVGLCEGVAGATASVLWLLEDVPGGVTWLQEIAAAVVVAQEGAGGKPGVEGLVIALEGRFEADRKPFSGVDFGCGPGARVGGLVAPVPSFNQVHS